MQLPTPFKLELANIWKAQIEAADRQNIKSGNDIFVGKVAGNTRAPRLILQDADGGTWQLVVDTTGALSTVKVTLST
ncbi:hypothetical protein [Paraburkholderia caribensis]|uniref:hypothetical protein n=1 Tax=Paraburkholderia caribensis TaxID=75105 RepID=UPI0020900C89|nr:hypothetical protein [Paraburkholderia caribensis]MCO4879059.1 hypothetical protein [Paraburkholderia caribensis]